MHQRGHGTPARRGRDLPLPLLIVLAIGAVLGERLAASRQKGLLIGLSLLVCVAVAGFGTRLAGRSGTVQQTPEPSAVAAAVASVSPTAQPMPTETPLRPTATRPTAAVTAVTPTASTEAVPSLPPATGGELRPVVAAIDTPTATPPPATYTPRGTTVIPILMYHYVRTVTDPSDTVGINLSVTPEKFAAQMQYLADNGYTTLTMAEVYAILAGAQPLPPKPVALTFDDGYRDFYTAAWPVLKKHNFKATSYIITSVIGWEQYMTWAMLQELDATGQVEIGSHTRTHPDLRGMTKEKRWDEIIGSKAILEEGLGHPVVSFCYPAGYYNADALADVKRAGYQTAVTTAYGIKQNVQGAFEMPRVRVNGPDSLSVWAGKLP
ncbi:MAG: polysaccharide deacetylase family protein [Thermomicrobiales bacterium]